MVNSSSRLINVSSRQLLAFLEICRHQSFARAAERVHLSPSGISMLVRELEQQVGAKLFERTTRSLTLTDAGRRLVPFAERVVEQLRDLDEAVRGSQAAIRSRLNVAATPIVATSLLPTVIRGFGHSHPHVRVHVADGDVETGRQALLSGEADIGLGFFVKPAVGLVRDSVRRFRLMCISPPESLTKKPGPSRTWRSLAGVPLVCLPPGNPVQALIETHLPRGRMRREDRTAMNFMGTLIAMVAAGLGHGVVPSFVLEECLRQGLKVSMLVEPVVHLDLYAVTRRGAQQEGVAADFISAFKRAADEMDG